MYVIYVDNEFILVRWEEWQNIATQDRNEVKNY